MQNSMVSPYRQVALDHYQTRTGDETALLAQVSAPAMTANPTAPLDQCPECEAKGRMITAEKAATVCQCSRRLIYRWIEEGALHFREMPDGAVLVCGVTLSAKLEQLEDATGMLSR